MLVDREQPGAAHLETELGVQLRLKWINFAASPSLESLDYLGLDEACVADS